ncbi:hypothetical protein CS022_00800 [Veronia nyctiphanis]|uniref:Fatty acid hydroxylase domain-containing protein n=1 Tax=Veronia nyctiphanis TaxID=1278244 RepID=A0A4Q0YWX4_9GAMM|nr:sterol desaturase family protein [Veronia nyctiphanis]RXJ74794.1 hypothetical protein CS022_00800 [Veronia nyctiphanis]
MTEQDVIIAFGATSAILALVGAIEFLFFDFKKRMHDLSEYKMIVIGLIVAGVIAILARPLVTGAWAEVGSGFALWHLGGITDWYMWPIALLVYEFCYWVHHWMGHKVRFFWCIHAPHHAPESINILVGINHSFIESLFYMPIALGFFSGLFGVDPMMVMLLNALDMLWGTLLHVSDNMVKKKYGILERFMQTPSYHRAHHGKNLEYMDTNYTSITLFWDTVFGTKVELNDNNPVELGITSQVDTGDYLDAHFGQFKKLWADVKSAPDFKSKVAYCIMPPGWSHTGEHHMVSTQKKQARMAENMVQSPE